MKQRGYSLIELMVVVTLVGILGTAMVGLFLTTLRSGGKATSIARIKEEGDYAISTMERLIRGGKDCNSPALAELTITDLDDVAYAYSLNSGKLEVEVTPPAGTPTTRVLTSANVEVDDLEFSCTQGVGSQGDVVTIQFDMEATGDAATSETFNARVVLRNASS